MRRFGLIGHPLAHSFSKKYFTEKFQREGIEECEYQLFDIDSIDKLAWVLEKESLRGFNVTIPYKSQVIPFLDQQDEVSARIGAVNVAMGFQGI